jgi:hypothetical protein
MERFEWVFLARPDDRIRVADPSERRAIPIRRKRNHQHFGARAVKTVEVAFECAMENDFSGADPVPAGVAGFVIPARQHNGGKRLAMAMARQHRAGMVAHPARRRAAEVRA